MSLGLLRYRLGALGGVVGAGALVGSVDVRDARMLDEWSLPEFRDVTMLIASELITYSVLEVAKYSWAVLPHTPSVRLWLRGGPPGVAIFVWDAVIAAPVPRVAGEDAESGRGLGIVAELSAACGFYHAADLGGKVTWAVITTS